MIIFIDLSQSLTLPYNIDVFCIFSYDIHHPLHSVDMEKIRPLHPRQTPPTLLYQNSTDSSGAVESEVEMETNTNELEKIVLDLAHSMRMNGVVCKFIKRTNRIK